MKILKRMLKQEKGAITMTVLAAMLFITTVLVISYFSIFNLGSNQNKKIQQISKQYSVTDGELEERYNQLLRELDNTTFIQINDIKSLGNIMLSKKTNTETVDTDGNRLVIPGGFKLTNEENTDKVEEGLVIQDKDGNEFVWIPVGIPWETDSSKTIELARYEFKKADDETAGTIVQTKTDGSALNLPGYSENFTEEGTRETETKNAVAKNINDFIAKTNAAGGFWIGRYEARVEGYTGSVATSNLEGKTSWTGYTNGKLVEKPGAQVFNYITQNKASELSKTMYTSDYFESDLINSYAWDTATLFLQEYDNRTDAVKGNSNYKAKYSNQIRLSLEIKNTGTNNLSVEANKDKICNVYDMADNCLEWTTETASYGSYPCVLRGGYYYDSRTLTSYRGSNYTTVADGYRSFRPVLYIK